MVILPGIWGLGFQLPDSAVFPVSVGPGTAFDLSAANRSYLFADPVHGIALG